jgi:hypothetical protein
MIVPTSFGVALRSRSNNPMGPDCPTAVQQRVVNQMMSPVSVNIEQSLADLITSLEEAQAAGRLHARLKVPRHPALLVVDEIGYLPISRTGAMLFFQLMTRRYEHASTVLTSNKGFEDWGDIFGDDVMAAIGRVRDDDVNALRSASRRPTGHHRTPSQACKPPVP